MKENLISFMQPNLPASIREIEVSELALRGVPADQSRPDANPDRAVLSGAYVVALRRTL